MNIVIIEDESIAARRLQKMVLGLKEGIKVVAILDSVLGTVAWLRQHKAPDLILMDIELVDGQSFEIFKQVEVPCPVIFTTAYDEYAIQAFKVNSIDYLLKPIQEKELKQSLLKFEQLHKLFGSRQPTAINIEQLLEELRIQHAQPQQLPRERILVKQGQRMFPLLTNEIAYFYTKERLVWAYTKDSRHFLVDYTLDELEKTLDNKNFFRANRQFIVAFHSVSRLNHYFNGKLKVNLQPISEEELIISREKALEFRSWLGE